jgi:PTH1 family peptidyl-tRNA hydrolase
MKIIVGLGNIGEKYIRTRHNCGFIVIDNFLEAIKKEENQKSEWKEESKLKAFTSKISYQNETLLLAKPTTLMNRSGESIKNIMNFFKEPIENLIVIYDDIDLPLGEIRIREKGSAGTHNGMKSVIENLGSKEFIRIRIGIESRGSLTSEKQEISSYVLSNFTENEVPLLKASVEKAIKELKKIISY